VEHDVDRRVLLHEVPVRAVAAALEQLAVDDRDAEALGRPGGQGARATDLALVLADAEAEVVIGGGGQALGLGVHRVRVAG
jgi:hypothetical protein